MSEPPGPAPEEKIPLLGVHNRIPVILLAVFLFLIFVMALRVVFLYHQGNVGGESIGILTLLAVSAVFCTAALFRGHLIRKKRERLAHYSDLILKKNITDIAAIAGKVGKPVDTVELEIEQAIGCNFISGAYIDPDIKQIILPDSVDFGLEDADQDNQYYNAYRGEDL